MRSREVPDTTTGAANECLPDFANTNTVDDRDCWLGELVMTTPADRHFPNPNGKHRSAHRTADDAAQAAPIQLRLARFMFDLQADDYDAEDAMRELAWADDGIRGFWVGQAGAVVSFLGLEACA